MEPFILSLSQLEFITSRLSQFYINNEHTNDFLADHRYKIPLNDYLCVCYGVQTGMDNVKARKIEFFRFIGSIQDQNGYWIQSFSIPADDSYQDPIHLIPSNIFRIQDCNHLRQVIFQFEDKTSLFRSTLFFVPTYNKMFRVHCVLQFLTLPVYLSTSFQQPVLREKFLISESKKKQILKRLFNQIALLENSITAHGALERTLP